MTSDDVEARVPRVRYEDCWAKTTEDDKPGISVRDHCLNVGCVAEALLELLPASVRALLPHGVATLAALHDIGKVSPGFQQKCSEWVQTNKDWFRADGGNEARHQRVSQRTIEQLTAVPLRRWAEAIGAHHGRVQGPDPVGELGGQMWHEARLQLCRALEQEFGALPPDDLSEDAKWLAAGLITLADWLGSDEDIFLAEDVGLLDHVEQRDRARTTVDRLELAGGTVRAGASFGSVFQSRLKGCAPRALQQHVIDLPAVESAVYVVEDAMGSGKTEAALWLAYRLMEAGQARGIYFGLPTRVTSDRIHRRVLDFLAEVSVGRVEPPLVHGHAWLREIPKARPGWKQESGEDEGPADQARSARQWFASSRRGLLAPHAVGTIDQALLGVVAAKWFFLRQFALAGKVVVIDEVHSYDLYTGTLIQHLVQRLSELGATPILLSATLTSKQRADLLGEPAPAPGTPVPYPAITLKPPGGSARTIAIDGSGDPKAIRVELLPVPSFEDVKGVICRAVKLAESGRNVVWIRNMVRHAQRAWRALNGAKSEGAFDIGLLHSRYPAFQRGSYPDRSMEYLRQNGLHEERWLWMLGKAEPPRQDVRPQASVLVSTQVVEQSVDLDADVLITDLAPTDMILQRLGRLHRHARGERGHPTLCLVVPEELAGRADEMTAPEIKRALGGVGRVYDPYVLMRSLREWRNRAQVVLPDELRAVLEATYADLPGEPAAWSELKEEMLARSARLESLALSALDVRGQSLRPDQEGLLTRFSNQRQMSLLLMRWVSPDADRGGNLKEIHLLNRVKLEHKHYRQFNLYAARELHKNTVSIPSWWLPKKFRRPLAPDLAQYFDDVTVSAVYDGTHAKLHFQGKPAGQPPIICYSPQEGLWLESPPEPSAAREEEGECEDGMF